MRCTGGGREERERGRSRIGCGGCFVAALDDREGTACPSDDDPPLAVLRGLRRLGRFYRRLGVERPERGGRAIEQLARGRVPRDDEVRVVRRVVTAVMRIKAVSSHQLDLVFATDHTLRVRMARECDRLQLLAEEE